MVSDALPARTTNTARAQKDHWGQSDCCELSNHHVRDSESVVRRYVP